MLKRYMGYNQTPFVVGIIAILFYYLPYIFLGNGAYINIHDFLDIDFAHTKMMLDNGAVFDYDKILPIMSGIDRGNFTICYSPYDLKVFLYWLLPAYWAIVVNGFIVRIIAFIGMYLLLKDYVLKRDENNAIRRLACLCALCFTFIPFYVGHGLSSAGIPLIFWTFFNLREKRHLILSYITIIFFADYSCFTLSGIFICFVLGVYYLYLVFKEKNSYVHYLIGLALLGFVYALVNIDLFFSFIGNSDFVSHRVEFDKVQTWSNFIHSFKDLFLNGHYHCGAISVKYILFIIIFSILFQLKIDKRLVCVMAYIAIVLAIYAIVNIGKIYVDVKFLESFNIERFYFFLPTLWILALAIALSNVYERNNFAIVLLFVSLQFYSMYSINKNYKIVLAQVRSIESKEPTFRQFYDEKLFESIKSDLGVSKNDCKVVCVGMYPAVAEYNGFHTLDSYVNSYPLDYKHNFREVIAPELEKDEKLSNYFDGWGSRCYLLSADCGKRYMYGKNDKKQITLDINVEKLRELGCEYIFSAVDITNYEDLGFDYVNTYSNKDSYWEIRVYKI